MFVGIRLLNGTGLPAKPTALLMLCIITHYGYTERQTLAPLTPGTVGSLDCRQTLLFAPCFRAHTMHLHVFLVPSRHPVLIS